MWLKPFTIYQPSYPAGINWGHPLAQGLVAYVIGNHQVPVDLVSGRPGVATDPTTTRNIAFIDGVGLDVKATQGTRFDFGYSPTLNLTGDVSGLFSGTFNGTATVAIFGVHGGSGASLEGTPLMLYANSAGTRPAFIRANNGGGFSWWNSGVAWTSARPIRYAFSQAAPATTTPVFWQDGVFTTPANDGNTVAVPDFSTNSQLRIGNRTTGDRQFNGIFGVGALWRVALTRRDLQVAGEAPYQILRPSAWKSSPYLVGGGGTSYSVSATIWAGIFGAGSLRATRTATASVSAGLATRGSGAAERRAAGTVTGGEAARTGAAVVRSGRGTVSAGQAGTGKITATRRITGLVAVAIADRAGVGLARAGAGRSAVGVSVQGSGSKISGASTAGLVALGVALKVGAAAGRAGAGAAASGAAARTAVATARGVAGQVGAGQAARAGFQVRRAIAGIVAQATGHSGQVAARRALRGLIAQGFVLLGRSSIPLPGNGLRRLVVLLDGRRFRCGISAPLERADQDQRRLAAPRDTRRLSAVKDD